jgi:hypothetical protein
VRQGDVGGPDPIAAAQALRYLPHLQPHLLAGMLSSGVLGALVGGICGVPLVVHDMVRFVTCMVDTRTT